MSPSRASMEKEPHEVADMFDDVAPRYDLTNTVLSGGMDHLWRRAVTSMVGARPGERVLDIGAGTGTSAEPYADRGVQVIPADFSTGMLAQGYRRRPDLPFTAADATQLPFADGAFDVVTMSFALRNVQDTGAALREFLRVVVPGGRLVICEFSRPVVPGFKQAYAAYLSRVLPGVARRVSSNPDSYLYLSESIQAWPAQQELADQIGAAGWEHVGWRNLTGGVVALHHARSPQRLGPLT